MWYHIFQQLCEWRGLCCESGTEARAELGKEVFSVKFRTRLLIVSLSIILLPLLLTTVALLFLGSHIEDAESQFGFLNRDNASFIYTIENYGRITEEILEDIRQQIEEDSVRLEDKEYLDELTLDLKDKSSYIIVRKGDDLYYTGNNNAAKRIFHVLPEYGNEMPGMEAGYYYNDINKLVKAVDFRFSDGSEGSIFIVTNIGSLLPRKMLHNMMLAFILVLVLTS